MTTVNDEGRSLLKTHGSQMKSPLDKVKSDMTSHINKLDDLPAPIKEQGSYISERINNNTTQGKGINSSLSKTNKSESDKCVTFGVFAVPPPFIDSVNE